MNRNDKYIDYYIPLIEKFTKELKKIGKIPNIEKLPEPFFNYFGKNYFNSTPKIAFIGRDTKEWGNLESFINASEKNPRSKIKEHLELFQSLEFTNWGDHKYHFFGFIMMLLAGLKNQKENWQLLKSEQIPEIFDSFAWANCHPVEWYSSSVEKLGCDPIYWGKVQKAGEVFRGFKHVLNTLEPDIAIILHKIDKNDPYFKDIKLSEEKENKITIYKTGKTLIYVIPHPNWMKFNPKTGADYHCNILLEKINELKSSLSTLIGKSELTKKYITNLTKDIRTSDKYEFIACVANKLAANNEYICVKSLPKLLNTKGFTTVYGTEYSETGKRMTILRAAHKRAMEKDKTAAHNIAIRFCRDDFTHLWD